MLTNEGNQLILGHPIHIKKISTLSTWNLNLLVHPNRHSDLNSVLNKWGIVWVVRWSLVIRYTVKKWIHYQLWNLNLLVHPKQTFIFKFRLEQVRVTVTNEGNQLFWWHTLHIYIDMCALRHWYQDVLVHYLVISWYSISTNWVTSHTYSNVSSSLTILRRNDFNTYQGRWLRM